MRTLTLIAIFVVAVMAYARLSPVRISGKHDVPTVDKDTQTEGGFTAVRPITGTQADVVARITEIALATPRTVKLSDDPLRFVTRSRLMGFPDVTTVAFDGNRLVLHAHLTIGRNDLGVNKARVLDWLDRLGPL